MMVQQLLPFTVATLATLLPSPSHAAATQLTADQFREMAMAGEFSAIIDVRTKAEWDLGHIINATLMDSLQNADTADEIATIADLNGCQNCPLLVYCRSGSRAAQALQKLELAGFQGPLYNGLGVNQWQEAGYELVDTLSLKPPCKDKDPAKPETCEASAGQGDAIPPNLEDAFQVSDDVKVNISMPEEPPELHSQDLDELDNSSANSVSSCLAVAAVVGSLLHRGFKMGLIHS